MREWRAVLASFGASTCLILAGTIGLAAVSTVIAFQGWPGVKPQTGTSQDAVLAAAQVDPAHHRRGDEHAIVVRPRSAGTPRRSTPRPALRTTTAKRSAGTVPVSVHVSPPTRTAGASGGAAVTTTPSAAAPKAPRPAGSGAGDPVRQVGDGLDGTVQQTTKGLGDVVRPISPTVANVLDNTGEAVGQTVKNVTDTVGAVLDGLKPKSPPPAP